MSEHVVDNNCGNWNGPPEIVGSQMYETEIIFSKWRKNE